MIVIPTIINLPGEMDGMKIDLDGKQYVVVKTSLDTITCRRTFWQWCKDAWKGIWHV